MMLGATEEVLRRAANQSLNFTSCLPLIVKCCRQNYG